MNVPVNRSVQGDKTKRAGKELFSQKRLAFTNSYQLEEPTSRWFRSHTNTWEITAQKVLDERCLSDTVLPDQKYLWFGCSRGAMRKNIRSITLYFHDSLHQSPKTYHQIQCRSTRDFRKSSHICNVSPQEAPTFDRSS